MRMTTKMEAKVNRKFKNAGKMLLASALFLLGGSVFATKPSGKKFSLEKGTAKVDVQKTDGSFNFSAVSGGKETPVLSALKRFNNSFFSVIFRGQNYNLNTDAWRKIKYIDDASGQIIYKIVGCFEIELEFKLCKTPGADSEDLIQSKISVTNLSKRTELISVKLVLDTVLGENGDHHFVTSTGKKIDSEIQFQTSEIAEEQYLISSDGTTSFQILFGGELDENSKATVPSFVSIINPKNYREDNLDENWVPVTVSGRDFKVASKNRRKVEDSEDSIVIMNWPGVELASSETYSATMFFCVGVDGKTPHGARLLENFGYDESLFEAEEPPKGVDRNTDEDSPEDEDREFLIKESSVKTVEQEPVLQKYQLDRAYIENLMNRIEALKADSPSLNQDEIRQLDAELDAILLKIRQK